MSRPTDQKRRTKRLGWPPLVLLGCLALTAYFGFHAIHGRYGLESHRETTERARVLASEIARLEAERARLQRDVALLSPEIPDPDLLDEIARDVLGYAQPTDRVQIQVLGKRG